MRRPAPRPLAAALDSVAAGLAPAGPLAAVQACWAQAAGAAVAAEAEPVAERGGVVTVSCRSAAWAHELDLLSGDLLERLNRALDAGGDGRPVAALRFTATRSARRP